MTTIRLYCLPIVSLLVLGAGVSQLHAQIGSLAPANSTSVPAKSPARNAPTGDFVLGAGDTLAIDVSDMPEVSTKAIKISSDGNLELPMAGSTHAAGLTVSQLRAELLGRLSKYVNDPTITINVVNNGSQFVSVIGEINAPGLHALDGPRDLIEVISAAGGTKADAGPRVIVTREGSRGALPAVAGVKPVASGNSSRLTLPLTELTSGSSPESNILILPGDVVSIPKEQLIYVVGDVHRAGGFPMSTRESVSVLQAISLAEGASPNASLKYSKILRPAADPKSVPTEVPINLDAILAGKAADQPLFANDVLFIPKSAAKTGGKRAAEIMLQVATGIAIYR